MMPCCISKDTRAWKELGRPASAAQPADALLDFGCVAGALVALFVQAMGWLS